MQKNDPRADRVGLLGRPIDGVPLVLCVMRPRLDYYIACVDLIGFTPSLGKGTQYEIEMYPFDVLVEMNANA